MKKRDFKVMNNENKRLAEKRISTEHVFDGRLLQVYVDDVRLPDGTTSTRDWIKHPGASAVVPVFEDGSIMLLKQFRYPAGKIFIEVPAGKLDANEPPVNTAKRELQEETGIECEFIESTGSFFPAIGYADEEIHVFVAWGLNVSEKNSDDDEFVINYRVHFSEALNMIETGEIDDGKTICALIKAFRWWLRNKPFEIKF